MLDARGYSRSQIASRSIEAYLIQVKKFTYLDQLDYAARYKSNAMQPFSFY